MNEDKIILKLIEHDERFERIEQNMVSKTDNQRVLDLLQGIATIYKNIQEDHLFSIEWIKPFADKSGRTRNGNSTNQGQATNGLNVCLM